MAANVIVAALIAGYVILVLYRVCKRKKSGLSGGCGCGSCIGECGGCSGCSGMEAGAAGEKDKKKMQG